MSRPLIPFLVLISLVLPIIGSEPAAAQSLAIHQAAPAASRTTPAKPAAAAIIPGSPLAALTGGALPSDADANTPTPFGTGAIGLSVASAVGNEATRTFGVFIAAIRESTDLTSVTAWVQSFRHDPFRRGHLLDILKALAITLLPGLAAEFLIALTLSRPRRYLAARVPASLAAPLPPGPEQGLADAEAGETEEHVGRRVSILAWLRRFAFALLHFGICIIPLAGFVLTIQGLVSAGLTSTRPAHLAVVGITNAYLICRISMEILRLLVAPDAPRLRLIHMPQNRAVWIVSRLRILLATGFFGYALVSVCEILGLGTTGATVLIRLVALAVHVELAICIWQSRRIVGGWIAGAPNTTGITAGIRQRLGAIWHYLALFYVLALWVAWAGGVQNAFGVLLRVVLVFIAAITLGRLLWSGSSNLLGRAFPDAPAGNSRHVVLLARARAYNPLLRGLIRVVIGALVIVLILQGWGINAFRWLLTNPFSISLGGAFIAIIITIIVALVIWEFANWLIKSRIDQLAAAGRPRQASRLRTLLPMLQAAIGTVIFVIAFFICLSKIGVNATPLLAVSGVLGIAIGFGSQKLVQDIITGLFLLLEDAMQVGDVITLAGMTGSVERLSIRTIRLRAGDGSINIIPFSAVTTVTNLTRDFGYAQISITVGYKENLDKVSAVLTDIAHEMRAEPAWGAVMRDDLQLFGLDQFGAIGLVLTGQIRTTPGQHWGVRREFYRRVQKRFAEEGIDLPYTQQSFRLEAPLPSHSEAKPPT